MSKILKNTTLSPIDIKDVGVRIPLSPSVYTIPEQDYLLWASSSDIVSVVTSGDIVVNDGAIDLTPTIGINYLKYPDFAESIRFTTTGPLISKDVNSAINESAENADIALNTPRFTINLVYNGTISNNTFIGYSNLVAGDSTPILIPIKARLIEITFSNVNVADFTLELRKNSTTATVFHTITKTSTSTFVESGISEDFIPGDRLYIKYLDNGTNANDAVIVLFLKAIP